MIIRVYVDAAYVVHIHDGKLHSRVIHVAESSKQKNVTKSSTEAELVALRPRD
jgi:hypothetical protein